MKTYIKLKHYSISQVFIFGVIVSMYAINDQKVILYPIKIGFILFMALRFYILNSKFSKYFLWGIIFITYSWASILWAGDKNVALYNFAWVLQVYLITMLIEPYISNKERLEYVLHTFIAGGFLLIIRLIIFTPISVWGSKRLGYAIGYNPNDVGLKLAFAALCCAYFIYSKNKKLWYVLSYCIISIVAILSGSKKSILVVLIGTTIFVLGSMRKAVKIILYIPIFIIISIGLYIAIMNIDSLYNVLGYRIEAMIGTFTGEHLSTESSTYLRYSMIIRGINMFTYKPILGYGIGNYAIESGFDTYSHNNYIELLVNFGFIGFTLYYIMYFYLILRLFNLILKGNKMMAFPFSIVLTILITDFALVSYITGYIHIMLMICYSFIKINNYNKNINKLGKGETT